MGLELMGTTSLERMVLLWGWHWVLALSEWTNADSHWEGLWNFGGSLGAPENTSISAKHPKVKFSTKEAYFPQRDKQKGIRDEDRRQERGEGERNKKRRKGCAPHRDKGLPQNIKGQTGPIGKWEGTKVNGEPCVRMTYLILIG